MLILTMQSVNPLLGAGFTDDFETPAVPILNGTTNFPAGWNPTLSFSLSSFQLRNIASTTEFSQVQPLASPAGGNQAEEVFSNEFLARSAGLIQPNTTYTLSAAVGAAANFRATDVTNWGIGLWYDADHNLPLGDDPAVVAHLFGNETNANDPVRGGWASNTISFNSANVPSSVGFELFVVIFHTDAAGASYFDNVNLTVVSTFTAPEPSTLILGVLGLVGLLVAARRRKA